jgi:hypothetical protein
MGLPQHTIDGQSLLRILRVKAAERDYAVLEAFVSSGAGVSYRDGRTKTESYKSQWSLSGHPSAWKQLTDDELIEALHICEEHVPGLTFREFRSSATVIDNLHARFLAEDRSLEERIAGSKRVEALIAEFGNDLPDMRQVTPKVFRSIPPRLQADLLRKFKGGSLEIIVRTCLDMEKMSLFEAFGLIQCDLLTPDGLIAEYGKCRRIFGRCNTQIKQQLDAALRDILRARGFEVGTITLGWNPRRNVRQHRVQKDTTRYVQSHLTNTVGYEPVKNGDIVVFDPDGAVLANTEVFTVIAVNFRIVCTQAEADHS